VSGKEDEIITAYEVKRNVNIFNLRFVTDQGYREWGCDSAIYTEHAPVRGRVYTMGLFDGDPVCRFCGMETETVQHIVCCCETLARQRYSVFGRLTVEPKYISIALVRDLCLFIRGAGLLAL